MKAKFMLLHQFRMPVAWAAILGFLLVLASCVAAASTPVTSVPIAVEKCGCFSEQRVSAFYDQGTLDVRGEFTLANAVSLPLNFYSHVRLFDADDRLLADISAKIERADKNYPGDPRLQASFSAPFAVGLSQVKRIKVAFDR